VEAVSDPNESAVLRGRGDRNPRLDGGRMRRVDPATNDPIIRGPLRLDRAWSYDPPPPPVLTVEQQIQRLLRYCARLNERLRAIQKKRAGILRVSRMLSCCVTYF
jgi:hypothetical protein